MLEPNDWQPIATAPEFQLVLIILGFPQRVFMAHRVGDKWITCEGPDLAAQGERPTHWMHEVSSPEAYTTSGVSTPDLFAMQRIDGKTFDEWMAESNAHN